MQGKNSIFLQFLAQNFSEVLLLAYMPRVLEFLGTDGRRLAHIQKYRRLMMVGK